MKNMKNTITGIFVVLTILAGFLTATAPALALTQPQVSIANNLVSANTTYTIIFTVGEILDGGDQTVIVWPAGTYVDTITADDITVEAIAGIGGGGGGPLPAGVVEFTGTVSSGLTMVITLQEQQSYGAGSMVCIIVNGVVNPATPGAYTLSVATRTAALVPVEAAVNSSAYEMELPNIPSLPGIIYAYNQAGVLMEQSNMLDEAIVNAAGVNGRLEMTPGTYTNIAALNMEGLKVIGIGEDVVIDSAVNIQSRGVTLENVTIKDNIMAGNVISINSNGANSTLCNITIKAGANATAISNMATDVTITGCSIDAGAKIGVLACNTTIIKNSTMTATTGGTAINLISGGTIQGNSINGTGGTGITVGYGTLFLEGNVLKNLDTALVLQGNSSVTAEGNTIDGCGSFNKHVIIADSPLISTFTENTIRNSSADAWAFQIWQGQVNAHYNNLVNNPKNVELLSGTADFTNNWWGSPDGPAAGSIAGPVTTAPFLPSSYGSVNDAIRHLPVFASKGQTFDVAVTFTAPSNGFNAIGLSDFSPVGWTVQVDNSWCTPPADDSFVTANRSDYLWYGPYDSGQTFTALYKVTVPVDTSPGTCDFGLGDIKTPSGQLEYFIGQIGPTVVQICGNYQVTVVEGASIQGIIRDAKGLPLAGVTVSANESSPATSNDNGMYVLTTSSTGACIVTAHKDGYRDQERTVTISNPAGSYTCNFSGDDGLIPNAPNLSYVLACINKWQYPPDAETGLTLTKVLAVINAWKYPA